MYSIIRTSYHKNGSKIGTVDNHNRRITPQPNVKEGGEFGRVFGDPNRPLIELVHERLEKLNVEKPKGKMADKTNFMMEFVVTASPEFFENCTPETLKKWKAHQVEWAKLMFNGRLVAIDYHNDETSPHFHICTVPVIRVTRKNRQGKKQKARGEKTTYTTKLVLSQSTMYTPATLEKLCTLYAESNAQFGLKRGEFKRQNRKSVNHTTLKEHREIVSVELPKVQQKLKELTLQARSLQRENEAIKQLLNTNQEAALNRMSDYIQPVVQVMKKFIDDVQSGSESLNFDLVESAYQKAPKIAQNALQGSYERISQINNKLKR